MTSVPFLFLSFETNILTTLSIIDIWNSNFGEKSEKSYCEKEVMRQDC
jgi:hypothetical protein